MEAEKIGVFELYQKIKKYNMDFFPLNNEDYIKQDCFWEDTYKGKEKEFIEEIGDATKISDLKDIFYFDSTINRGTN